MKVAQTKTAEALTELMQEKSLTKYKLAKEIGVSQSTIANYLEGKTVPQGGNLFKLATYFEVNEGYFLGTEPKMSIKKAPDPKAEGLTAKQIELIELVKQLPDSTCDRLVPLVRELLARQESQDAQ